MAISLRQDFDDCYNAGSWAEQKCMDALNEDSSEHFFIQYGLSKVTPQIMSSEYFDKIVDFRGKRKRPDLLGFENKDAKK